MEYKFEVSVCVVTYNQEATISRTIDSILEQEFDLPFEIIIGEDCSTDKTLEICLDYQFRYPEQVRVISSESNVGLLANVKRVTDAVRGRFFGLCAGDDFWHNKLKIKKQYDYLLQHTECVVVYSSYLTLNVETKENLAFRLSNVRKGKVFDSLLLGNFVPVVTAFIRTQLFKDHVDLGKYAALGFLMEDYPMWLDLSNYGGFGYIDEPLATYQISGDSISSPKSISRNLRFARNVVEVKKYFAKKYDVSPALLKKSIYISNIQMVGLIRRYHKGTDVMKIISKVNWIAIFRYLFRA